MRDTIISEREARTQLYETWQTQWDGCGTGRETYTFIPSVIARTKMAWLPDHFSTQFITGHGNVAAYLYKFGFKNDPNCENCGVPEEYLHIL